MSLFSALPIAVDDSSLPKVNRSDVRTLGDAEFGTYDHWIFDKGDSAGLVGIAHGTSLTQGDVVPTFSDNYLTISCGPNDGLRSMGITDDEESLTLFAVVRQAAQHSGNPRSIFGTYASVSGFMLDSSGALAATPIQIRPIGLTGMPYAAGASSTNVGSWYFYAVSLKLRNGNVVRGKIGGQTATEYTPAGTYAPASTPLALGNYNYNVGPAAAQLNFGEYGIIRELLSTAELDALYLRSKARMAERGIAVV